MIIVEIVDIDIEPFVSSNNQKEKGAELIFNGRVRETEHGKKIKNLGPDAEAVLNDMQTDINMPFVLKVDGNELDLVAKTVMRKKNFKTKGPKLSFEEFRKIDEKNRLSNSGSRN